MSGGTFREQVDSFVARQKRAAGRLTWSPSRDRTGLSGFWLLAYAEGTTAHRLHVVAYPARIVPTFTIMVEYQWLGREYPVMRLDMDDEFHEHVNRPPRPLGVPPSVKGNRVYPWSLNRLAFHPLTSRGLPFCMPLRPQGLSLPSAIRHLAALSNVDLTGVTVPDRPPRKDLFS